MNVFLVRICVNLFFFFFFYFSLLDADENLTIDAVFFNSYFIQEMRNERFTQKGP